MNERHAHTHTIGTNLFFRLFYFLVVVVVVVFLLNNKFHWLSIPGQLFFSISGSNCFNRHSDTSVCYHHHQHYRHDHHHYTTRKQNKKKFVMLLRMFRIVIADGQLFFQQCQHTYTHTYFVQISIRVSLIKLFVSHRTRDGFHTILFVVLFVHIYCICVFVCVFIFRLILHTFGTENAFIVRVFFSVSLLSSLFWTKEISWQKKT